MTPFMIGFWLVAAGASRPAAQAPADLHVVYERQFNFLSSTRTTTTDWWVAPGRSATRSGDRLTIRRDDLGVRWRVDLKAGTYVEEKLAAPTPATAPAKEDIHTAGFDYEPDYAWTVGDTGRKTTLAGRPCREFMASGDADYADATVKFWMCEPIQGMSHPVTETLVSSLYAESSQKLVRDTSTAQNKAWPLGIEETQEPAISPTMIVTVTVKSLEAAAAPAGTFELPAGVKKAGAK